MHCFISHNYKHTDSAGNKAKHDMETLMRRRGMCNIGLATTNYTGKIAAFAVNLVGIAKALATVKHGDVIFLQYPLKKYYATVCRIAHLKGAKTVTLIHDLGSQRRRKLTVGQEIKRLSHTDCVITLNNTMSAWLKEHGSRVPSVPLEIWDYLSKVSSPVREYDAGKVPVVVYAGGLARRKNMFLYEWGSHIDTYRVHLYGRGFSPEEAVESKGRIEYKGFASPDELITMSEGSFGLVWDGHSLEACEGDFGAYLRLNNPHKASLYIRCGLPLLIWKEAALAPFVEREGVGILISSLSEIDEVMAQMTPERYSVLCENVARLSKKMSEGGFYNTAIDQALAIIQDTPQ